MPWIQLPQMVLADTAARDKAMKDLESYRKTCPEAERPLIDRALKIVGEPGENPEWLRKALPGLTRLTRDSFGFYPDDFQVQFSLATAFQSFAQGNKDLSKETLAHLQELVKKFPQEPQAHLVLAGALLAGNTDEAATLQALREYKECLHLNPAQKWCKELFVKTAESYQRPSCKRPYIRKGIIIGPVTTNDIEEVVLTPDGGASLRFSESAKEKFREFTSKNIGTELPLIVGGKTLTAPRIQVPIPDGRVEIVVNHGISLKSFCVRVDRQPLPKDLR